MSTTTSHEDRRKPVLKLSSVWVQGVALVMIFGFLVMGFWRTALTTRLCLFRKGLFPKPPVRPS